MGHIIGRRRYAGETYPQGPGGGGGGGGGGVPLSRQRFIDGDTAQTGETGSAEQPFSTIADFIASRGNASVADATANYVGWLMPALNGYTEDISFPPYASTEIRADSFSTIPGSGVTVTGNVTWANIAGTNAATGAAATMHNIFVVGNIEITDDVGAPDSIFVFGGDEVGPGSATLSGGFLSSATTKLSSVQFVNAVIGGSINTGTSADNAVVVLTDSICTSDIAARALACRNSTIDASAITIRAGEVASFIGTTFLGSPVLTATGTAQFDGPSWRSFLEAGGTRSAATIVLVVGGYNGGSVEGTALTGASTSVALNGTGATAGFTNGGNHYSAASATPTTVTLLTAGALPGDTLLISRTTSSAANLAVINGGAGAGTIGTIPSGSRGFVRAQFDGTNWSFAAGGSLAA